MSAADILHGFAYGEQLDGASGRSLGYRLLAPAAPEPWTAEVEALAHHLQAAPYPEHWPAADLFCSVLLATGQRLVARVRYGVTDRTPGRRRGGLELVGVVGPRDLDGPTALRVYGWLRQRKTGPEDLQRMDGVSLRELPAAEGSPNGAGVLPVRAWQGGTLLIAASAPAAPDQALGLLEQTTCADWQWLPLCGPDFPLETYARRGPLVAWTPQLLDVAVRLAPPVPAAPSRRLLAVAAGVFLALLAVNLWALWSLPSRIGEPRPAAETPAGPVKLSREDREETARAVVELLQKKGAVQSNHPDTRALADRVSRLIEDEFRDKKGYDPALIQLIRQRVHERLVAELGKGTGGD
jgi:hypothetical protein